MDLWYLVCFWVTIGSTWQYVQNQFLWNVLCFAKAHMPLGDVQSGMASVVGVSLLSFLHAGD